MRTPRLEVPPNASEGVIKYSCELVAPRRAMPTSAWQTLEAWRTVLVRLGIVGQCDTRYDGYGFGNLSLRSDASAPAAFWITGTQTGHLEALRLDQYAEVIDADLTENRLSAAGVVRPTSEAPTNSAIYAPEATIGAIFHAHSPDLFGAHAALGLPAIDRHIEYGTPAMAEATAALLAKHRTRPLIFATLGHEDGIFAAGARADVVGSALVERFAAALKRAR